MSKKTFSKAPTPKQPTDDQILAFERGGTGHDKPATRPVAAQSEPIKRLSVDLPASAHTRFKTACSAAGRKMVAELHELIERRTQELETQVGIKHK